MISMTISLHFGVMVFTEASCIILTIKVLVKQQVQLKEMTSNPY